MKKQNDEVNIKDLIGIFLPKIWIIVLCAITLSAILGAYAMFLKEDTYTAKATLTLTKEDAHSTNMSDIDLYTELIAVLAERVESEAFLNAFIKDVKVYNPNENLDYMTTAYLSKAISISANNKPFSFTLSVTTTDPQRSLKIAKEVVYTLVGERGNPEGYVPEKEGDSYPYHTPFTDILDSSVVMRSNSPDTAVKNSKGVLTNALIGLVVGAVISMAVIYVVHAFDIVIHDRKKLEERFDIPVLGVIPRYEVHTDASAAAPTVKEEEKQ